MSKELTPREGDIIFYTTPDGSVHIEVFFQNETFWRLAATLLITDVFMLKSVPLGGNNRRNICLYTLIADRQHTKTAHLHFLQNSPPCLIRPKIVLKHHRLQKSAKKSNFWSTHYKSGLLQLKTRNASYNMS